MLLTSYQKYMLSICLGLLVSLINIKFISKSFTHKLTKEEKDLLNKHLLKNDHIYDNVGNVYSFIPVNVNKEYIRSLIKKNINKIDNNVFTEVSSKKIEKERILNDLFSKIKYTENIEKNIIEILYNLLNNLGIEIINKKYKEEDNDQNIINIPNTNRYFILDNRWSNEYFDNIKRRQEEDEFSRYIWGDIHKNDDDSFNDDIFHDTKLLFNINTLEDVKEFGILVGSLIFMMENPNEILKYFDITNITDKKTRFFTFLSNKNTINYRYFNNLEENLSNYFFNIKKEKNDKILVCGRELLLIKHVYLCLRISIITIY